MSGQAVTLARCVAVVLSTALLAPATAQQPQRANADPPAEPAALPTVPVLGKEYPPADEPAGIAEVQRLTTERFLALFPPGVRPVLRDAHPKMHGLVRAEFIVPYGLPESLRYGIFKNPGTYQAWIRFSASAGTPQPDYVMDGRGMAIKLMGVQGTKVLPGASNENTQDFVMINFPTFFVRDVKDYLTFNVAVENGNRELYFREHPTEFAASQGILNQEVNNPIQIQYWSQTPYQLGPHAIKFSARPISSQHDGKPASPGPEFLTEAMAKALSREDVYFDFMVQVQSDPVNMPVEDALTLWDDQLSPFQKAATIRIPKQSFNSTAQREFGENLSYTPWHCLPDHRPLGGINRARLTIYESLSKIRHEMNGVTAREPTGDEVFTYGTGTSDNLGDEAGAIPTRRAPPK
jgi:hypothetical protein